MQTDAAHNFADFVGGDSDGVILALANSATICRKIYRRRIADADIAVNCRRGAADQAQCLCFRSALAVVGGWLPVSASGDIRPLAKRPASAALRYFWTVV
jgi:hypothetical protein